MEKRYNVLLAPVTHANKIIRIAQHFSSIADQYLLGDTSLPHVTLYLFNSEQKMIENIWKKIIHTTLQKTITLTFNQFSHITFDGNIYWISLLPDKRDTLQQMHTDIANTLMLPINASYDPHMSLLNTKNSDKNSITQNENRHALPLSDLFVLALGEADNIGQVTQLIYQHDSTQDR